MQHKFIAVFIFIMVAVTSYGQGNDNSVYSRFGLGDPTNNNFMHLRHMGSLGASYHDPYHINIVNPASLAHLRAVAFDMGVYAKIAKISDQNNSETVSSGSLEYVSIALPLSNPVNEILEREDRDYGFGMAFTLMPHTTVGYNISSLENSQEFGTIERNFKGTGGTNKFLWSNSARYKDFSFGVNLGYLFGKISYERSLIFQQEQYGFNDVFTTEYSARGVLWNLGFLYTKVLNKDLITTDRGIQPKRIIMGVHYGSSTSFTTKSDVTNLGVQQLSASRIFRDTLFSELGIEGEGTLPSEIGVGFTYQNGEKLTFGVNYTLTNWSKYTNDANPQDLKDAFRISAGGYYRPNYLSQKSYWDRVYYRFGIQYSSDPRSVEGSDINSYGLDFGIGLPFIYQRRISHANLGVELGFRGRGTPIEESFISFSLGFTFNDSEWFLKRRYD